MEPYRTIGSHTGGKGAVQDDMEQSGVHKIFFVWYPKFFPKNLSYKTLDCLYKKCDKKAEKNRIIHKYDN